jgi:hypothetical protein
MKQGLSDHLALYVLPPASIPESQNSGARRDSLSKHVPVAVNVHTTIEGLLEIVLICGLFHIKYSVCSERKVGNYFFPELLVRIITFQ